MSDGNLLNPEYIEEMENALDQVKLQMTLDLIKGMIQKDHFLLMNWQLFKFPIEETAHTTTFNFMGPFGNIGAISVIEDGSRYECFVDNGHEKFSSQHVNTIDEVVHFIFACVDEAAKKTAA